MMLRLSKDASLLSPEICILRSENGFIVTNKKDVNKDPFNRDRQTLVAESVDKLCEVISFCVQNWHEETISLADIKINM